MFGCRRLIEIDGSIGLHFLGNMHNPPEPSPQRLALRRIFWLTIFVLGALAVRYMIVYANQ